MKFKKIDAWHIQSDEGYRVAITVNNGVEKFEAWPAKREPDTKQLGIFETLDQAIKACIDHHNQ